jgi:hypothetical protein
MNLVKVMMNCAHRQWRGWMRWLRQVFQAHLADGGFLVVPHIRTWFLLVENAKYHHLGSIVNAWKHSRDHGLDL